MVHCFTVDESVSYYYIMSCNLSHTQLSCARQKNKTLSTAAAVGRRSIIVFISLSLSRSHWLHLLESCPTTCCATCEYLTNTQNCRINSCKTNVFFFGHFYRFQSHLEMPKNWIKNVYYSRPNLYICKMFTSNVRFFGEKKKIEINPKTLS